MTTVRSIGHGEVQELIAEARATVIDALPPGDYAKLHLPGAINVPIQDFTPDAVKGIDRERAVVTYCADSECDLSARAAARMIYEGFEHVYEFVGGIAEWGAFGLSFEGEDADVARAGNLAAIDLPMVSPDTSVDSIEFGEHSVAAVIDEGGVLQGKLRRDDAGQRGGETAGAVMSPKISTFRPDVHLAEMAEWFKKRPKASEFIITTPDGRVYGVLYRAAVKHVLDELKEETRAHA